MTDLQLQTAITNLATGSPNTAEEMRNILNEFYARSSKYGDIRMKDVSNAYISENFDGTGLGINLEVGWAIVNGQNLTRQWNGRVPLAFGTAFPCNQKKRTSANPNVHRVKEVKNIAKVSDLSFL